MSDGIIQDYKPMAVSTPLGDNVLLLQELTGEEELSRLFQYDLELQSEYPDLDPVQIVGHSITIRVDINDSEPRYINGIVSEFTQSGWADRLNHFRARVVPWFWLLDQRQDCRIYQEKTVQQIVEGVFNDLGFSDFKFQLTGNYKPREYCVQYRETDFNFVSRLLEEEGIFYYFRHENGKHTMVIADSSSAYFEIPDSEVEFSDASHQYAVENRVTEWQRNYTYRPGKFIHTDYNFKTPSTSLVRDQETKVPFKNNKTYEIFDYHGRHEDPDRGRSLAKVRQEEIDAVHDIAIGKSYCGSFTPGARIQFSYHQNEAEIGQAYALTKVRLYASIGSHITGDADHGYQYRNDFECLPASVPYRPQRLAEKPVVEGPQTAMVIGEDGSPVPDPGAGKEIYVDEHARVKVLFHWVRPGTGREISSCWIRVAQPWAGVGFGAMNIPRIGHEVVVDFLEGDPDCPLISSRVYNAEQMPHASHAGRDVPSAAGGGSPKYPGNSAPGDIPAAAMMTSFKSNSLGGSGGSNEITMNDAKDAEGLFMKAEKDEVHTVGNDREDSVGNDESRHVGNNRFRNVGANEDIVIGSNQTLNVGVNRTTTIGTDDTETVGNNQSITIGVNQTSTIGSNLTDTIGLMSTTSVGVNKMTSVGAAYELTVGAAMSTAVGHSQDEQVGINKSVKVGDNMTVDVGKQLSMSAGDQITLKTGKASIMMKKDGTITIKGKDISIIGSGKIQGKAKKNIILKGKKILEN